MKKLIVSGIVILLVLIILLGCFSIVGQRERGINYTFGKVVGGVIEPGIVFKAPFISHIKKYSIAPKTYEVQFSIGHDAATTKDLQSVATAIAVKYCYDENRIMDIATKYGDSVVESAMRIKILSSVKSVIGTYTIYELVEKKPEIQAKVGKLIIDELSEYPIVISTVDITNFDWSDTFDRMIEETNTRTQQVKTATQEAEIAAAQAQKLVKQAEAEKQAAELNAKAMIAKAQGEAEAKKIVADANAYEAKKIAENQQAFQKQWDYEINLERAKRWNGKEVPDSAYVVPGTGAVVPLTTK